MKSKFLSELKDINHVLQSFGLNLDENTGGVLKSQENLSVTSNPFSQTYQIVAQDGSSFDILDGDFFLRSLRETELSFRIKLFVNT